MNYDELIVKARRGRSVSAMANDLGMSKMTLNRYVRGTHIPDYRTAGLIAREANVSLGEAMAVLIAKEEQLKGGKDILSTGFRLLVDAWNRLIIGIKPAY